MSNLSIITTADGSNTIYNAAVGENYHSKHGAYNESRHVFLNNGLLYSLPMMQLAEASVLEVGFGTGLNFLLTADYCIQNKITLNYTGIEAYPLTAGMIAQTGYQNYVSASTWNAFIHQYPSSLQRVVQVNDEVTLTVTPSTLLAFDSSQRFDVIYFDAFAARYQPEMWNDEAIAHTVKFLKPGGAFVTYAITGVLKRQLAALGLQIKKLPGAPGKREMLRAEKPF